MPISRTPQFVIKISKYCNLRCDYCYEYPHLGNKARMSLEQLRALFENIAASADELSLRELNFIWHGGEPFLVPIAVYERIDGLQKEIFGSRIKYFNTVQTNLTVLTDRHLAFLKTGFFRDVGVSFDVYGDQRVDTKGALRTGSVLANLQKLLSEGIRVGAIAVLARNTLPRIRQVYGFYDDLGVGHRMLAFYRSVGVEQSERHGLDFDELLGGLKEIFHAWLASERATRVDPIDDMVRYAVRHISGASDELYRREQTERVFMIDVDGSTYNSVESYDPDFLYGNLFESPLAEVANSDARRRSIALSQARLERFCAQCPYYGNCPGGFVANATQEERKLLESRGCPVRAMLDHIVETFERTQLTQFVRDKYRGGAEEEHPALAVA